MADEQDVRASKPTLAVNAWPRRSPPKPCWSKSEIVSIVRPTTSSLFYQARVLAAAHTHLLRLGEITNQRVIHDNATTILSIDVEAYEKGKEVLEVGLAWIRYRGVWPQSPIFCRHFVVKDHLHLHNGTFVPDHRGQFDFGESEYVMESELQDLVTTTLKDIAADGDRLYLVGHSVHHDVRWLEGLGVDLGGTGFLTCDIGQAYQASRDAMQLLKLESMMDNFSMAHRHLHNAANDAYYSLLVCLQMMEAEEWKVYGERDLESGVPERVVEGDGWAEWLLGGV